MPDKSTSRLKEKAFYTLALFITTAGLSFLLVLLMDILHDGLGRLSWKFFTSFPSRKPEEAGVLSAWVGTLWVMIVTGILSIPVGISAGIFLEEYGKKNWLNSFIEINIANLAGVPSIIYGLFGLEFFVRGLSLGRCVLAGSATLALLILPMIVMSTREAIRAVPFSIREASFGVGATKLQTIIHQVLPAAMPGIMTGIILALSRAIGETAPLITIGALTYVAFLPDFPISGEFPYFNFNGLFAPFTTLPIQIFNWVSRPQKGFHENAAGGIIVLLIICLGLNAFAIYLRHRYSKVIKW